MAVTNDPRQGIAANLSTRAADARLSSERHSIATLAGRELQPNRAIPLKELNR